MALAVASGVCGLCLHVYDKRIRFVLQGLGWGALLLSASGAPDAGAGAALATLAGLAFKEQFCFAIPGIRAVPLLLPLLWLLELAGIGWAAALVALVCGLLLCLLSLAKWAHAAALRYRRQGLPDLGGQATLHLGVEPA